MEVVSYAVIQNKDNAIYLHINFTHGKENKKSLNINSNLFALCHPSASIISHCNIIFILNTNHIWKIRIILILNTNHIDIKYQSYNMQYHVDIKYQSVDIKNQSYICNIMLILNTNHIWQFFLFAFGWYWFIFTKVLFLRARLIFDNPQQIFHQGGHENKECFLRYVIWTIFKVKGICQSHFLWCFITDELFYTKKRSNSKINDAAFFESHVMAWNLICAWVTGLNCVVRFGLHNTHTYSTASILDINISLLYHSI